MSRNFATNAGIAFKTPEEFFLHEPPHPFTRDFEPSRYLNLSTTASLDATPVLIEKKNRLDIIIFCGSPGSGKSTFFWTHLQPLEYERVNQDILKTVISNRSFIGPLIPDQHRADLEQRDKCVKVTANYLREGKAVAVGRLI